MPIVGMPAQWFTCLVFIVQRRVSWPTGKNCRSTHAANKNYLSLKHQLSCASPKWMAKAALDDNFIQSHLTELIYFGKRLRVKSGLDQRAKGELKQCLEKAKSLSQIHALFQRVVLLHHWLTREAYLLFWRGNSHSGFIHKRLSAIIK